MKKKLLLFVAALLTMSSAWADDIVLSIDDVEVPQGGSVEVPINITNDIPLKSFQAQITLEGINLNNGVIKITGLKLGERTSGITYTIPDTEEEGTFNFELESSYPEVNGSKAFRFLGYNGKSEYMKETEGAVAYITISAANEVAIGTTYTAHIVEANCSSTGASIELPDQTFTITVGKPRITLDENVGITSETPTGLQNVLVKRTISANNWNTICLPFDMSAEQIASAFGDATVQLADFTGCKATYDGDNCTAIKVNFTDATTITANKPCLIKVSKAIKEFKVDGVTINANEASARIDMDETTVKVGNKTYNFYNSMIGTYKPETPIVTNQLFLSNNKFYYSTGTAKMKAFRAYFDFQDELKDKSAGVSNAKISFFVDENTTGISDIKSNTKVDSDAVYNINGQYVGKNIDMNTLPKGVYIINGQKKIVK
jgi:hypothetical protein